MDLILGLLSLLVLFLVAVLTVRLVLFVGAFTGFLIVATLHLFEWCGRWVVWRMYLLRGSKK
jgi:hypothetical protein